MEFFIFILFFNLSLYIKCARKSIRTAKNLRYTLSILIFRYAERKTDVRTTFLAAVQASVCEVLKCYLAAFGLEGSAVGALGHGGVRLVGHYLDLGKRAVVILSAMVRALGDGASDGMVGGIAGISAAGILVIVHFSFPFGI